MLFIFLESDFNQNRYFIGFRAAVGVELSNSYMLEEEYEDGKASM
jgi:hypothetical protein